MYEGLWSPAQHRKERNFWRVDEVIAYCFVPMWRRWVESLVRRAFSLSDGDVAGEDHRTLAARIGSFADAACSA